MTSKPAVSVIVPTFNRANTLPRALSSILGQSLPPAEIIVVDDGSTDNTAALLSQHYPAVQVLHQPNRGVSAARNAGISRARGEWIALLDSDDEWLPHKLEVQLAELLAAPQYRVCHTEEIWIRNGKRVNAMKKHAKAGGWIFQRCLPLCAMSPSSVLIHHSIFETVGMFDETLPACEDYDLWLRTTSRYPVLFVEEPLIRKFGGHDDQLSRRYPAMDRFRIEALGQLLHNLNLADGDRNAALATLRKKVQIYAAGARKRGKDSEAERVEALLHRVDTTP